MPENIGRFSFFLWEIWENIFTETPETYPRLLPSLDISCAFTYAYAVCGVDYKVLEYLLLVATASITPPLAVDTLRVSASPVDED